jgi:hypothetical protein
VSRDYLRVGAICVVASIGAVRYQSRMENKRAPCRSEVRLSLTMSRPEMDAINAYIEGIHRTTGGHIPRAELIRQAIREMIEREGK